MTLLTRSEPALARPMWGLVHRPETARSLYEELGKPVLDRMIALLMLCLAAPVMVIAMALVKLTSRGSALYAQERLGRHGRRFTIYKIRSMYDNCEAVSGARWCLPDDPRVTPVGWVLRRLHIDELPQLWNVLRGELSLVGPRPERPELAESLVAEVPQFPARLAAKPGLSGLAQVQQPPDTSFDTVRRKLYYDLHYIEHLNPWLDLRIMAATMFYIGGAPARWIAWVFRFPADPTEQRPQRSQGGVGPTADDDRADAPAADPFAVGEAELSGPAMPSYSLSR